MQLILVTRKKKNIKLEPNHSSLTTSKKQSSLIVNIFSKKFVGTM